ncbi:MAG: adenylate kinase [Brevinematia bacterium]
MINLVLIAPPGGGKGTQAEKIVKALNIAHISTGDIFRSIVKGNYAGSFPVSEILNYMNKGLLVPDDIVVKITLERLGRDDCKNGFLLDGFPRTLNQARMFDELASDKKLNFAILIDVNEESLVKRLTGRRSCPKCGRIYNVYYFPPRKENVCDDDGEKLVLRDDDKEETVRKRLEVYKNETIPLISYYQEKNILFRVDGNQPVEDVFRQIMEVLKVR